MVRLTIGLVVAVLLFGGLIAADQTLQNPDVEPADDQMAAEQESFVETTAPFIEVALPVGLFALVIGSALAAVRAAGGG